MKLVIFGGTFDPVHNGHLEMIELAFSELGADRMVIVPTGNKAYKLFDPAPAEDREEMLRLAVGTLDGIIQEKIDISNIETADRRTSYTIDTVKSIIERYTEAEEVVLLMGADTFRFMSKWPGADEIRELCTIAVVPRRGTRVDALIESGIDVLPDIESDASSGSIRKRIRAGESVSGLIPETVAGYIERRGSYIK